MNSLQPNFSVGTAAQDTAVQPSLAILGAELAELLQLPQLGFDERGRLTLMLGDTVVLIEGLPVGLGMTAWVHELPEGAPPGLLEACLQCNLNAFAQDAPVVSLEGSSRAILLQQRLFASSGRSLLPALEQLGAQVDALRASVSQWLATPQASTAAHDSHVLKG